jgi:hypothetical protein
MLTPEVSIFVLPGQSLRLGSQIASGSLLAPCDTILDESLAAERWLSGRKQRFAKPS